MVPCHGIELLLGTTYYCTYCTKIFSLQIGLSSGCLEALSGWGPCTVNLSNLTAFHDSPDRPAVHCYRLLLPRV